jgi:ABC-type multidrug transport system fused ATPase/permease subunit
MQKAFRKEYFRLLAYLKHVKYVYFSFLFLCCAIDAYMATISAALIKKLYDAAVNKEMESIIEVSIILGVSVILLCLLSPFSNYYFGKTVKKLMVKIKNDVFNHVIHLPVREFDKNHSGTFVSILTNDIGSMESVLTGNIRSIISILFTGILSFVYMLMIDYRIALILLVLAIISTIINLKYTAKVRELSNRIQEDIGKSTELLIDLIAGIRVIKMFGIKEKLVKKYMDKNDEVIHKTFKRARVFASLESTNFFVMWINNGGMLVFGIIMILNEVCTLGTVLSMLILQQNIVNLFRGFGNLLAQLQVSLAGAGRVFDLMDRPEEEAHLPVGQEDSYQALPIDIRNGSFSYDDNNAVLHGISLHVEHGKMAALVGPSGGGKSTILKLLLGFYPLEAGSIQINGRDIGQYKLSEIRDMIAYVPQDPYLFNGTIRENIAYGRPDATMEEIVQAAKVANVHEFIMEQPEGYDTIIGDFGVNLSGGQRQRIAIVRAILKDAPILLLDEATSSLDFETEKLVQEAINQLMQGRTILVIAHRLSTIRNADMIYVVEHGRIREKGTHESLMEIDGTYKRLYLSSQKL